MRWNGHDAIGLGVVMAKGGNVLTLGTSLDAELQQDQERAARRRGDGTDRRPARRRRCIRWASSRNPSPRRWLIVMAVSFLSLGWRTGIVVALAVPLVLAGTMVAMLILGIDLHRISLGALIISLGLLVDDAIIAVEMMVVKIEQGWDRVKAGAFAYTSTAFPMLPGTIVTAAGFVPVGFAQSAAGEYTNAIFWVVALSLLISWIVAVIFTPYLGFKLLPKPKHVHPGHDVYDTRVYRFFRAIVTACVRARWVTIGTTVAIFVASIVGFGLVQQQFFPSASRPELLVDIRLAEGSSFSATAAEVGKMEKLLDRQRRYRLFHGLHRCRLSTLLSAAGPAAPERQFCAVRGDEPRSRGARARQTHDRRPHRRRISGRARAREPAGERPTCRLPGAVPRARQRSDEDPRDRLPAPRSHPRQSQHHGDPARLG